MRKYIFAMIVASLMLVPVTQVWAVNTSADTTISNQASVEYWVNSIKQTDVLSDDTTVGGTADATTFKVDRKVDLTVGFLNHITVTPGQNNSAMLYSVTNDSNDTIDIGLAAANILGDTFAGVPISSTLVGVYVDAGTLGSYDVADTAVYIDELGKNQTKNVWIVVNIPAAATNTLIDTWALRATAKTGGVVGTEGATLTTSGMRTIVGVETVLADAAGSDDDDDAVSDVYNGIHSANSNFIVSTATLTVTKSVAVYDDSVAPQNPEELFAIPGAVMIYAIGITNSGALPATGVTLVDQIPANTSYYVSAPTGPPGSTFSYNNAANAWGETPSADGNGVDIDVTAIKINLPDISGAGGPQP